jgi:hypothetical protein
MEQIIVSKYPEIQRCRIPTFSDTRSIDRHDGVLLFKKFIHAIKSTLEDVTTWSVQGYRIAKLILF